MQLIEDATHTPCTCGGRWIPAAEELLQNNRIAPDAWRAAMVEAMRDGRKKGNVVTHVGIAGTEGKSFLFKPIHEVFGKDNTFVTVSKNNFPLLGLERKRVSVLDDWRFNEDAVSYNLQLLWFEGAPIIIARPQNEFSGHLKYAKDDPVFISTLEADLLTASRGCQDGDVKMMLKRLKVFRFTEPILHVDDTLPACAACFSQYLLLGQGAMVTPRAASSALKRDAHQRSPTSNAWNTEEVVAFLKDLGLGDLEEKIRESAVDGRLLNDLSVEDLVECLEIQKLQALKIKTRLP